MSFSQEWEHQYLENSHLSVWPWSDLVSLVKRNCKNLTKTSRVLELGCGAGANIPFFQSLGVQYYAVEGSKTIVSQLHRQFPDCANYIVAGDFTKSQPFEVDFDLIVDRAAITCNSSESIRRTLQLVWESLVPGGYFVGIDWYSTRMSDFIGGNLGPDENTRTNFESGTFAQTGNVHFSDNKHLAELFSAFEIISLEEKMIHQVIPSSNYQFASWLIVARKPND